MRILKRKRISNQSQISEENSRSFLPFFLIKYNRQRVIASEWTFRVKFLVAISSMPLFSPLLHSTLAHTVNGGCVRSLIPPRVLIKGKGSSGKRLSLTRSYRYGRGLWYRTARTGLDSSNLPQRWLETAGEENAGLPVRVFEKSTMHLCCTPATYTSLHVLWN